ncbi:TonB-dependent receptor [Novosphingobium sp. KACC 22771]|uniref:TonB-dependent receptor n=1 Tax=Novosphingobium sp. KACC 22771 TaxID=3025670 RepID=UPI002365FECF|nr:TonB-dependent receptor [Novosphingobium sp. KACC 22771]WDF74490.1 TonB-dependent receptor [Novosphingobium sp. KACC 22771]
MILMRLMGCSALALAVAGFAGAGHAAETPAAAAADPAAIRVIGHPDPEGLLPEQSAPKAISAISADFIIKQAPTLNAFQLVNLLPGANVSSSDPYGLSTSSSLTMRGLGQDEIGVLMEGAPQNDIGYYYAYPSQFADAENVRQVALAQGSVDLDSPVLGTAGGLLSLSLDDPAKKRGALVDFSLGSYKERRGFVRFDTGLIGNSGVRAFISYSNNRANNWRGAGYDLRNHIDAKLLKEWGEGNRASLAVSFNSAKTSAYPGPSLADWQTYGRGYNFAKDYTTGDTSYWRFYRAPFRNIYLSAPVHLRLNDRLSLDTTTYLQWGYGNSPYGTQLATTGNYLGTEALSQPINLPGADTNGVATVLGNWTGNQFRGGNVTKLVFQAGAHRLTAGVWFDYGNDRVIQSYTPVGADGRVADEWGYQDRAIRTADGRLLAYENARTLTVSKAFFVADSIAITDRLTADVGFKGVDVLHSGRNFLPGPQSGVHFDSFAALPRAALHFRLDDRQQLFANITTNFRAPNEYTLYNTYDYGEISTQGTTALKNEYSVSQELGYRYIGPNLSFSLTGFHYHFRNRQLSTVIDSGGALVYSTINAGSQTSYGIDGEIDWRPAKGVSLYVSGEYLKTRIDNDMAVGNDWLPTRGKQAVSSPSFQFGVGSTYDDGRLFGSTALKYVNRQYSTFMNDESIPAYATLDLSVGLHLAPWLDGKRTDLRVNAINITNPRVLSGVQSVTLNAQDTIGRGGTVISGAAPAYYIGSGRAFVVTLARAF